MIDVSGTVPNLRQNATVIAGKTLSGELNDTSDITKKYDVKILNTSLLQFTTIAKQIAPKSLKLNDEKNVGISKNYVGLISDNILSAIPLRIENKMIQASTC